MRRDWDEEKRLTRRLLDAWRADEADPPEADLSTIIQHLYVSVDACNERAIDASCSSWYEEAESFAYHQYDRFLTIAHEYGEHNAFDTFTYDGKTYDLANYRIALAWHDLAQHFLSSSDREPDNTMFWELLAYKGIALRDWLRQDDEEED